MAKNDHSIILFRDQRVRRHWDNQEEEWYFSIIDIIAILTVSTRPRKYWNELKTKLAEEGSELSAKIGQLKMPGKDGKLYATDVASTEHILRLIQSVPSPKAEPFKLWLARVGYEHIDEIEHQTGESVITSGNAKVNELIS